MSETIPETILAEARAAFERVQADAYILGGDIDNAYIEWDGGAVHIIAHAIIAAEKRGADRERERCAKIADDAEVAASKASSFGAAYVTTHNSACRGIASTIRQTE